MTRPARFRSAFVVRSTQYGAFVKSPGVAGIEILAGAGLDFVLIDEEHAPFNRESVDAMILAARASGIAPLVRVPALDAAAIQWVLDCGAEGVFVPHIRNAADAWALVDACYYGIGRRGLSPSGRAGGYGTATRGDHMAAQDNTIAAIAMIEDPEAVDDIDAILAVPGLTGVFIGQGDLTAAYGVDSPADPKVSGAVDRVCTAARATDVPVCLLVANPDQAAGYAAAGVQCFLIGSDQGFLRRAARQVREGMVAALG